MQYGQRIRHCSILWYEENITRLNELEPDIVWWPVYTDYNYLEWNNTVKFEYAKNTVYKGLHRVGI